MSESESPDAPSSPPRLSADREDSGSKSCLVILMVWGLPAVVVPLIVLATPRALPIGILFAVGFLCWMGKIGSDYTSKSSQGEPTPQRPRILLYVVIQLVLNPLLWLALAWGICMTTGTRL